MKSILYGPICLLQDPKFIKYDAALDNWYLDENAWNIECCAVANAGADAIRLLPWGVWSPHPYGIKSQFQPYMMVGPKYTLGVFNTWYFPIVTLVIEIAKKYGLVTWFALLDNCQFAGGYGKWSPWGNNTQNIYTFYDLKAFPYVKEWFERCISEFAGLNVAWAWGNETQKKAMVDLVKAAIFPVIQAKGLDWKRMTYGATMEDAPYADGQYEDIIDTQGTLKKLVGEAYGDPAKLKVWREVHSVGGKGYPAVPNRLHQAETWWMRKVNNGIRVWLSDDGVYDGDSECDFDIFNGNLRRRPSATRWYEIVKMTCRWGNDLTFEHLPKTEDLACKVKTMKAIFRAVHGYEPEELYHYDPPVEPPVEPPQPPEPPTPPTPPASKSCYAKYIKGRPMRLWQVGRFLACLLGGRK